MNTMTARIRACVLGALVLGAAPAAAAPRTAMPVDTVKACYVNGSGTIYRIGALDAPAACTRATHIPMKWPDGQGDDYTRYLLADGVRSSTNGFAVYGTFGQGSAPTSGAGSRLMWYPGKAAFRAGLVNGTHWNDANVGRWSQALGVNVTASGDNSVAIGNAVNASGTNAIALGFILTASGNYSTALGRYASTNNRTGAFVYGDASEQSHIGAMVDNHFVVRAQRVWFGTNSAVTVSPNRFIETSTGAYLSTGGAWINSSDVNRKDHFRSVDSDAVLAKVAALPITTWSYKDDAATVRHIGPMAQDFHRAFGLGDSETSIATVDADGVALAAIRALEKRTRELSAKTGEVEMLRQENTALRQSVSDIAAQLDAVLRRLAALEEARR